MSVEIINGSTRDVIPTSKINSDASDGKVSKFSNITKTTKEFTNKVKEFTKNIFSEIGKFFSNTYNKVMSYKRNYDLPKNVAIRLKDDLAKQILKQESYIVRDAKGRPTYNAIKARKQMDKVKSATKKYAQHLVDMGLSSEEIKAKLDEVTEHKTLEFPVQYTTTRRTTFRRPLGKIAKAALYDDSSSVICSAVAKRIEDQLKSGIVPKYNDAFMDEISLIKDMMLPGLNTITDKLSSFNSLDVEDLIADMVLEPTNPILEQQKERLEETKTNPMAFITTKDNVLSAERATLIENRDNANNTYDTALVKEKGAIDAREAFEAKHSDISYMDVLKEEVKASPGDSQTSIAILEYKRLLEDDTRCSTFATEAKNCLDVIDGKVESLNSQITEAKKIDYTPKMQVIVNEAQEKLDMIAMLENSNDRIEYNSEESNVIQIA